MSAMLRLAVPEEGIETLFGSYDENLKHLESLFSVRIRTQGHELVVEAARRLLPPQRILDVLRTRIEGDRLGGEVRTGVAEAEREEGSRQIFNYRGEPVDIRKWQIPSMSKIAEKLDHVFWAWADEHSTLDKVQKAITALGRTIGDMSNMARKMELRNSKITDKLEHFVMDEVNPIIKKMISFNVSLDDIKQYLHARHAEEYNNRMNEINHRVDAQGNIIPYGLKDRASDRKSTRLNSSHIPLSRMPSSA